MSNLITQKFVADAAKDSIFNSMLMVMQLRRLSVRYFNGLMPLAYFDKTYVVDTANNTIVRFICRREINDQKIFSIYFFLAGLSLRKPRPNF